LLLAACGGSSSGGTTSTATKAPDNKQIFIRPLPGFSDIKSFDPAIASDLYSAQAIGLVFTGLVELNDQQQVIDQLAASHSVAADGTSYTFKLKPNLKFSDGTPLTSADVAYSLDRAFDPATKSPTASYYLNLIKDSDKRLNGKIKTLIGDSLITPDPQTITIKTSQKAGYFLNALTIQTAFVVEKSMIQKYGNNFADHLSEGIGGAGPWMVSKYQHGKDIEFVPNPNYYGPKPQLKKFIIPFYQSPETAFKAYQTNQVDYASSLPPAELDHAKALPNGQFHQFPILSTSYATMNYLAKPFDNIKIRQAFALALNKDEFQHNIFKDTFIATNHIVPVGMPGYNPNLTGPDGVKSTAGDPALAKQLFQQGLQEEGLTLSTFPQITYTTESAGAEDIRNLDAVMQQMWKNVLGVNVTVNDIDFNKLLDEISAATNNPKGIQMWGLAWIADYPDPQDWLTLQFDKGSQQNNMNYGQNKSATAAAQQQNQSLMEQADANLDNASRMPQYQQAEQQAVNDVAWLPLYQQAVVSVVKPCVVGLVANSQELTPPDDWANIYKTSDPTCANVSQYQ
jgi:peptide/nickel transport system substrate-binding protein/oligopeptide transport system substrate-binding protein